MKSDSTLYDSSCGSLGEVEDIIANFKGKTLTYKFNIANTKKGVNNSRNKSFKHQEVAENSSRIMNREHNAQKVRNR